MSDRPQLPADATLEESSDDDREAILERRSRFIRAALTGLAGASIVAACGGEATGPYDAGNPAPCLDPPYERDAAQPEASAQPCLGIAYEPDATTDGGDASDAGTGDADATPQPCLIPPLDSGSD